MKKITTPVSIIVLSTTMLACDASKDSDGVPKVDIHGEIIEVKPAGKSNGFHHPAVRVRMITVDEKKMPLAEFLNTYCQGKNTNETCSRGSRIDMIDSSSGPEENLPAGL